MRAYVKTAAFKPLDDAILDGIIYPWTLPGGKAAFYRQIAQANSSYTDEERPDRLVEAIFQFLRGTGNV